MKIPTSMPRLKGFRYTREIIAYAVWAYHRFAMSTADVEDLLSERGVIVSHEAVRLWANRFVWHFTKGSSSTERQVAFRRGRDLYPWQ
jgi:putative transposase